MKVKGQGPFKYLMKTEMEKKEAESGKLTMEDIHKAMKSMQLAPSLPDTRELKCWLCKMNDKPCKKHRH